MYQSIAISYQMKNAFLFLIFANWKWIETIQNLHRIGLKYHMDNSISTWFSILFFELFVLFATHIWMCATNENIIINDKKGNNAHQLAFGESMQIKCKQWCSIEDWTVLVYLTFDTPLNILLRRQWGIWKMVVYW